MAPENACVSVFSHDETPAWIPTQADGTFDALVHTGTVVISPHNPMPEPFILPVL